jgi:hypothetical protein
MVNDRFPQAAIYGFEMVDVPTKPLSAAGTNHQSKIYAESNRRDFSPKFRRFNLSANTCDLSTFVSRVIADQTVTNKRRPGSRDVFPASHGILARACARAPAKGKDA